MSSKEIEKIKVEMLESAEIYFLQTGEKVDENFLSLIIDALIDEYKVKNNYPVYFTDAQIELDVASYFARKKNYFVVKVIPAVIGKLGAEGLQSLSDTQVSRVWLTEDYFADVIPYCEVL